LEPKLPLKNFLAKFFNRSLIFYPLALSLQSLLKKTIDEMKKGIHPEYKDVVFWDTSSDHKFITRSTQSPKETIKWEDGKEYPVIKVEVSSASHPFFTGKKLFVDTAGRVEKFKNKYQKKA
jgi:large subunit ribosomal protein L31